MIKSYESAPESGERANAYLREEFGWFIADEYMVKNLKRDAERRSATYIEEKFGEYKQAINDDLKNFRNRVEVLNDAGFLSDEDMRAWRSSAYRARREMVNDMFDILKEANE